MTKYQEGLLKHLESLNVRLDVIIAQNTIIITGVIHDISQPELLNKLDEQANTLIEVAAKMITTET